MLKPSKLLLDYTVLHTLCSLQKVGVFDKLANENNQSKIAFLASALSLDEKALETICDFLVINAPEILKKNGEKYELQPFYREGTFQNALFFTLAYESVFSNLSSLLTREKIYGKDVQRDGKYLRLSSALYNERAWDALSQILKETEVNTIVDLGCSAGDFLSRIKKTLTDMRCFGVEIDLDVLHKAETLLSEVISDDMSLVIHGDVSKPEEWREKIVPKTDFKRLSFIGITVWHEFLKNGERDILEIFSKYRRFFPGSTFIIVEYNGFPILDMATLPESLRESGSVYQLIHPLTGQGQPDLPSLWKNLFEKAGIHLEKIIPVHSNTSIYICTL